MEKFKQKLSNYNIIFACQTGSQLFCSNCNDVDYLVVVDNLDKDFVQHRIDDIDYFCMSVDAFVKMATMQSGKLYDLYSLCLLYGRVIEGQNPIADYNWFDYQQRAVDVALWCGERNYFARALTFFNENKESVCSKRMIWALATYYTILNQSSDFTIEQIQTMQRCHDRQLPRENAHCLQEQLVLIKNSI